MATRLMSNRFVGRRAQLEELDLALREAAEGRPGLVLIGGESGVGKTRLVSELERQLADRDVNVLRGEAVELAEGELPFAPLTSAFRPLVRARHPAFDRLGPGAAPSSHRCCRASTTPAAASASDTIRPPSCACSRRCSSCSM